MKRYIILTLAVLALATVAYAASMDVTVSFTVTIDSDDVRLAKVGLASAFPSNTPTVKAYCTARAKQAAEAAFNRMVSEGKRVRKENAAVKAAVQAALVDGLPPAQ